MPAGRMPIMATRAKAMTARLMAISIMVKAEEEKRKAESGKRKAPERVEWRVGWEARLALTPALSPRRGRIAGRVFAAGPAFRFVLCTLLWSAESCRLQVEGCRLKECAP